MANLEFSDCNCFIGLPPVGMPKPVATAAELLREMDRSGISRALVWHVLQRDFSEIVGNDMLTRELAGHRDRLAGCWALLPTQTKEMPKPSLLFEQMAAAGVRALTGFPRHRFLLRGETFGAILRPMVTRRIPLMLSMREVGWDHAYDLLKEFPKLTCVLTTDGCFGSDRLFRPLIERYPNVYFEISEYILDGGIEAFVDDYGPKRLLYGSGFPKQDHGGMMLALRHAEIDDTAKRAIAGGNFAGIMREVKL